MRLVFFLLLAFVSFCPDTVAVEKPNVIFFMADDMGMGDTSAYQDFTGNADGVQIHTPNMERLARMGVRFTDAHTPASRCTTTRYGLLTGRYCFRSRLKYWVLFGSQGDPLIERDRPTLGTLFQKAGYGTALVGKWHVGLRYRRSDGKPAAGWADADLSQPLFDGPLDHGFDYARFTSRSHGTSGPDAGTGTKKSAKKNSPNQNIGPGHIHGRTFVSATPDGKQLLASGPNAYVLNRLGSRHSDHAIEYLDTHLAAGENATKPFFLYYPSNSNHGPYTPDVEIGGKPVAGAARTKSGNPMDARHDYIYENDVALGRLLDYLEANDDPRHEGKKLIDTTVVVFTSDNGAEKNSDIATGPFRSHKGSCYEGGHRVPFIVAWGAGGIGDGRADTPGESNPSLIGLVDMYATLAELIDEPLPDFRSFEKGAEDSISVLAAWKGETLKRSHPLLFNDHKESKNDPAVLAMRLPTKDKSEWKAIFDSDLIRFEKANLIELYDLATDPMEEKNRVNDESLKDLKTELIQLAKKYRSGGVRIYDWNFEMQTLTFDWTDGSLGKIFAGQGANGLQIVNDAATMTVVGVDEKRATSPHFFDVNNRGLGISGGKFKQVDSGEAIEISFDKDVYIHSIGIVAGNGICGGSVTVGSAAPIAIYCVDSDNDSKDQHGNITDVGPLKAGEKLRLGSSPHFGSESPGQWRLGHITVRPEILKNRKFKIGTEAEF